MVLLKIQKISKQNFLIPKTRNLLYRFVLILHKRTSHKKAGTKRAYTKIPKKRSRQEI